MESIADFLFILDGSVFPNFVYWEFFVPTKMYIKCLYTFHIDSQIVNNLPDFAAYHLSFLLCLVKNLKVSCRLHYISPLNLEYISPLLQNHDNSPKFKTDKYIHKYTYTYGHTYISIYVYI